MMRSIVFYGVLIAAAAFVLQWLEYKAAVRLYSTELYIVLIAILFTALGIWVGVRLSRRNQRSGFERNDRALEQLRISEREYEVLQLLAAGYSNKEIANRLFVSLNTIKTHLAHVYDKLDVNRRTQAVHKAKALRLIP